MRAQTGNVPTLVAGIGLPWNSAVSPFSGPNQHGIPNTQANGSLRSKSIHFVKKTNKQSNKQAKQETNKKIWEGIV